MFSFKMQNPTVCKSAYSCILRESVVRIPVTLYSEDDSLAKRGGDGGRGEGGEGGKKGRRTEKRT